MDTWLCFFLLILMFDTYLHSLVSNCIMWMHLTNQWLSNEPKLFFILFILTAKEVRPASEMKIPIGYCGIILQLMTGFRQSPSLRNIDSSLCPSMLWPHGTRAETYVHIVIYCSHVKSQQRAALGLHVYVSWCEYLIYRICVTISAKVRGSWTAHRVLWDREVRG